MGKGLERMVGNLCGSSKGFDWLVFDNHSSCKRVEVLEFDMSLHVPIFEPILKTVCVNCQV